MAGKPTTIAIRAVAQDKASRALKTMQATFNKVAKDLVSADKKVQTQNAKSAISSKSRMSASKKMRFAMAKQAAGSDKTARSILALNIKYERSAARMRKLAKAGKPIPMSLAKQANASKKAAAALQAQAKKTQALKKAMKGLGKAAMIGAPLAAGAAAVFVLVKAFRALRSAITEGVTKSIEYEKALGEVMTIADGAQFSIEGIRNQTSELGKQFATSPTEQAKALYQAISGGANTAAKAQDVLTNANRLAISGVTDITTATDGLVNIMNVFGSGEGAIGAARAADILQAGVKQGKTTVAELATELGGVSGIAKTAGLTLEELVGAVSTITTKGVTTSAAVTQVKSALVAMASGAKNSSDEAKKLFGPKGAFSQSAMKAAGGFVPFMKKLASSGQLTEKSFKQLFGRVEGVNALLNLVGTDGGAKYQETIDAIIRSNGEVETGMQTMMATTAFQVQQNEALRTSIQIAFGEAVTGSENANAAIKIFNEFLAEMQKLFNSPEGRAAVNDFFGIIADGASVAILSFQYLRDHLQRITGNFRELMTMTGLMDDDFNAMPLNAAQGYDKFNDALDALRVKLSMVSQSNKVATDEERKNAQKANKEYEKSYQAGIKARTKAGKKAAEAARKQAAAEIEAARKTAAKKAEINAAARKQKAAADKAAREAAKLHEQENDAHVEIFKKVQRENRQKAEKAAIKQLRDLRDQELEQRKQKEADQLQTINDLFTGAYSVIRAGVEATFMQIGQTVDGELMTWGKAFGDFFKGLGKAALNAAMDYVATVAIKAAADKVAAMIGIQSAAAETGAKSIAAHSNIPFVGLGIGLAAAAAGIAAALAFRDDVPKQQVPRQSFNTGGIVKGPAGIDRVPAMLTAGEFVVQKSVVDQIRGGRGPTRPGHYNDGGLVTPQSAANGGGVNITLATQVPADRAQLRRMVREVIVPELKTIQALGAF